MFTKAFVILASISAVFASPYVSFFFPFVVNEQGTQTRNTDYPACGFNHFSWWKECHRDLAGQRERAIPG
jgi:hypothetical protein